jgi:rhodanese-related sulfurtransferase
MHTLRRKERETMTSGIELDRLLELIEGGAQLVDVLPEAEYEEAHLPGAINIPLKQLDANSTSVLPHDRPVVVYCWDSL